MVVAAEISKLQMQYEYSVEKYIKNGKIMSIYVQKHRMEVYIVFFFEIEFQEI